MSNSNAQRICAFTGHRPAQILGKNNEDTHAFQTLRTTLEAAIRQAIAENFTIFRSGGAMGFDLWAAEAVLHLKAEHPHIQLHFILPCETQANDWPEEWRERYFDLLSQADAVAYIQAKYTGDCMFRRNRALVDGAQLVIAYYDDRETGGTAYTVRYAGKQGLLVRNLYSSPE